MTLGAPAASRAERIQPARRRPPSTALLVLVIAIAIAAGLGALGGNSPVLAIAAAGALLIAVSMAIRPEVATLVVLAVLYSNAAVIAVQFHGVPAFAALAVPILLIVPVGYELVVRHRPVVMTSSFPLMIVFLLIQVLGTIFADDVTAASDELLTFLVEGIGLYFLVSNAIRSVETLRWAVWVLLAVGTILGALSLYQDATKTYDNNYLGFAQMSDALIDSATPARGLATAAGRPDRREEPLRPDHADARATRPVLGGERAARACRGLLPWGPREPPRSGSRLTFSRGAAVGFLIVLVVMIALGYIRPAQILLVGVAVSLLLVVVPTYGNRLGSLVDLTSAVGGDSSGGSPDGAVLSRATEGLTALLVFADHPLIGVGPGRFPSYYRLYADDVGIRVLNSDRQAHDLYLHIAAENGGLGLLAFLGILALTLRDLIRVRRRWLVERPELAAMATGLMLAVVTYMTTGLFLHLSYARYFWLVLAIAGAAAEIGLRMTEPAAALEAASEPSGRSTVGGRLRRRPAATLGPAEA